MPPSRPPKKKQAGRRSIALAAVPEVYLPLPSHVVAQGAEVSWPSWGRFVGLHFPAAGGTTRGGRAAAARRGDEAAAHHNGDA
jgi:hypothetical protein